MEITAVGIAGGAPVQRGRPRPGGTAFVPAADASEAEAGIASTAPGGAIAAAGMSGLAALLALQEAEAAAVRDRDARRHGQALLTELAAVQRALLGTAAGDAEVAPLQRLAALAEHVPEAADPALAAIIGGIAVRARVELARRGL